jgi:hypothetical protein
LIKAHFFGNLGASKNLKTGLWKLF